MGGELEGGEGSTNVGWAKGDLSERAQGRKGMFKEEPKRVIPRASSIPSQERVMTLDEK